MARPVNVAATRAGAPGLGAGRHGWFLAVAAICGAFVSASAYWPGLMDWDPVHQYGEALSSDIGDWHPPAMQWLWRQAIRIMPGPAPMLVLQLALYWGGLTLLAQTMVVRGRAWLGWAVLACGLLPLGVALMGMIYKDCLMAGALLAATGLLARRRAGGGVIAAVLGVGLLLLAATLRFNAFIACLPLFVAFLPIAVRRTWPRLRLASLCAGIVLVAAMPVANRVIGARHSGVELSLVIFDLGGITEHGSTNVFPAELEVPHAVAANHACYDPARWDSYSNWVDPECPLGFTAWNDNVDPADVEPYTFWARAILLHPLAYAEHRLIHFAINTRILPLADAVQRPVPDADAPNPWGFHVTPNFLTRLIDVLALTTAHTPVGWPIVWIGVAASALLASRGLASSALVAPIALSALLYGSGYLIFSVASELRYHLWTEIAALIALVLALGDPAVRGRAGLWWSFTPAVLALTAGVVGHVVAG